MSKLVEKLKELGKYEIAYDELPARKKFGSICLNPLRDTEALCDGVNALTRYLGHAGEIILITHNIQQASSQNVDTLETIAKVGFSVGLFEGLKYFAHRSLKNSKSELIESE